MNNSHPINDIMGVTMQKIRELVDVNTIIGTPIKVDESTTIIPISQVKFGFATGGSDLPVKIEKDLFGGGGGAGVTISPVAFLVIAGGETKLLQMSMNASSQNAVINMIPDVFDKVSETITNMKKNKD